MIGTISLLIIISVISATLLDLTPLLIGICTIPLVIRYPQILLPILFFIGALLSNHFQIFVLGIFLAYQAIINKTDIGLPRNSIFFLLCIGGYLIAEAYQTISLETFRQYLLNFDFLNWSTERQHRYDHLLQTFNVFNNIFLILVTYQFFKKFKLPDFQLGIILGVILLQMLSAYQIFIDPFVFSNLSNFWLAQQRFSGTFTDPNAFAISSILILGFLLFLYNQLRTHYYLLLLVATQVWLTLYSGSRSFFLAILLTTISWTFLQNRKLFYYLIASSLSTLLVINILFITVDNFQLIVNDIFPTGILRVLQSLNIQELGQTFFSRQVFNQLNFLIFKDYPFFGIGLNQFDLFLPRYQHHLNSDIGTWVDNSNNFYFGIITELGLLGFITFIILLRGFSLDLTKSKILIIFFLVFACLLLLGPHFYFTEVSLLFGLLVSQIVAERETNKYRYSRILKVGLGVLLVVGIMSNSRYRTTGLYPLEQDERGRFYWSTQEANIFIDCSQLQKVALEEFTSNSLVQSYNISELGKLPFKSSSSSILLKENQFICPDLTSKYKLHFKLTDVWYPSKTIPTSQDQRALGLKVRFVLPKQ